MTRLPTLKEEEYDINTPRQSTILICPIILEESESNKPDTKKEGKREEKYSISCHKIENEKLKEQPNKNLSDQSDLNIVETEKKFSFNTTNNRLQLQKPECENEMLIQELLNKLRTPDQSKSSGVDKKNERENLVMNIVNKLKLENEGRGKDQNQDLQNKLAQITNLVKNVQDPKDVKNKKIPEINIFAPNHMENELQNKNFMYPSFKRFDTANKRPSYRKFGDKKHPLNICARSLANNSGFNKLKCHESRNNSAKTGKLAQENNKKSCLEFTHNTELECKYLFSVIREFIEKNHISDFTFFDNFPTESLLNFSFDAKRLKKHFKNKLNLTTKFLHALNSYANFKQSGSHTLTKNDYLKMSANEIQDFHTKNQ